MNKEELIKIILCLGFKPDRYGHYQKTFKNGKTYRLKFGKTALRFEVKTDYGWFNIVSDYFKNITSSSSNNGQLINLVIKGKRLNQENTE
jgi:hypothetical protein